MSAFFVGLIVLVAFGAVIVHTAWAALTGKYGRGKVIGTNIGLWVLAFVIMRLCTPVLYNQVVYQGIILHIFYAVPVILALIFGLMALSRLEDGLALTVVYGVLAVLIGVGGCMALYGLNRKAIVTEYGFDEMEELIGMDPQAVRYTPLEVAHKEIENTFSHPKFTVEFETVDAIDVGDGMGYRGPITPNGPINVFTDKNRGFVTFDDRWDIADEDRLVPSTQEFQYGEEMQWLDNIFRQLYQRDCTAYYPNVYYPELPGEDGMVAVAPKIEYAYRFPCYFVPVWKGVTLVFDDGRMEDVPLKKLTEDERFKGKFVFPAWLSVEMVEARRWQNGWLQGFFYRFDGKIELPELPGRNQWPIRIKGADGHYYDSIAVEPDGQSYAFYQLYMINCSTGERLMKGFEDSDTGLLGPVKALDYVKKLEGYIWYEKDGENESGTHRIVEPRLLIRQDRLYWMYTITNREMVKVFATAVVDCASREPIGFRSRASFGAWLHGQDVIGTESLTAEPGSKTVEAELQRLEQLNNEMTRTIERLKLQLQSPTDQ